jgi:hypothetical protein
MVDLEINILNKYIDELNSLKILRISVYLMLLSYFYNLSVLNYSIKGDNELRLYDLTGLAVFYIYLKHFNNVSYVINFDKTFRFFKYLLQWATFSLVFTFAFSIAFGKFKWGLQSLLYIYHFWIFFLTAVYLRVLIVDKNQLKKIVTYCLIFGIITFLIVILQNLQLIPFLWSDIYLVSYNFLSGTLGPNKIVLGMTCLFVFTLSIGLFNDKRVQLNKYLTISAASISLLTLIMSGSRTAYVALFVFLGYFFLKQTKSFAKSALFLVLLLFVISITNSDILTKSMEVFQNRVENKIKNPNAVKNADIDALYEDLGAGRKGLSMMYIEHLVNNPYIIPIGVGFNNRLVLQSSAHNMYLSIINELGLLGFYLYFRWLFYFLVVKIKHFPNLQTTLFGLVLSMIVTLFFGEHLYVYRPLFGLFGLFFFIIIILMSPNYIIEYELNKNDDYGVE